MPWWLWGVIWTVLVLGLLGVLVFFAFWLFHKLMAAAHEASTLMTASSILSRRAEELQESAFHSAVFIDADDLRVQRQQVVADRRFARQARRDQRVKRGKILTSADPFRYSYLGKRT